jgi:hypothetical protein
LTSNEEFALLIKIIFKAMEQKQTLTHPGEAAATTVNSSNHAARLKQYAQHVVRECTRRNRQGDLDYIPLQAAVERRLRAVVGDDYWTRAKQCVDGYMQRRRRRVLLLMQTSTSTTTTTTSTAV